MTPLPILAALRSPAFLPDSLASLLFENHWSYWIVALLAAAVLFYISNARQNARLRNISLALAALTGLWALLAFLILTPAERLYNAHTGLADAAKNGDVDRIVSYLAPNFQASVLDIPSIDVAREEISARLNTFGIQGSTIRYYKYTLHGHTAFTQFNILTQTSTAGPILTSWNLSWDDLPGEDWRIRNAELTMIGDQDVSPGTIIPK
ncbi:MAG: hypothetical protein ACTHN5_22520 [Phycisphaerae bacterium]